VKTCPKPLCQTAKTNRKIPEPYRYYHACGYGSDIIVSKFFFQSMKQTKKIMELTAAAATATPAAVQKVTGGGGGGGRVKDVKTEISPLQPPASHQPNLPSPHLQQENREMNAADTCSLPFAAEWNVNKYRYRRYLLVLTGLAPQILFEI